MRPGRRPAHSAVVSGAVSDDSLEEAAMDNTTRWARRGGMTVFALLTLVACSDDKKTDPTTTVAETVQQFGARVQTECPGGDPGFDPFLAAHSSPTAADWAGFLPAPRKMLHEMRDCIAASHPPAVVADKVDAVVAAFDVVITDFDKALAAAKAGDLATTEKWITQMHDTDQPKIDEAINAVGVG